MKELRYLYICIIMNWVSLLKDIPYEVLLEIQTKHFKLKALNDRVDSYSEIATATKWRVLSVSSPHTTVIHQICITKKRQQTFSAFFF